MVIGLLVAFVTATVVAASGLESAGRLVSHAEEVRLTTEHLVNLLADAETGQRGFIITNDPAYLDPYTSARQELPQKLEKLVALTAEDTTQRARAAELRRLADVKLGELQETLDARRASGFAAAQALVLTHRGKRTMDALRKVAGDILAQEEHTLQQRTAAQVRRRAVAAIGAIATAALVFALLLLLMELRRTHSSVEGERRRLQSILDRLPFGLMMFDCSTPAQPECLLANDHARSIARINGRSPVEAAKLTPLRRTLYHGEEVRGEESWLTHTDGSRALVRMNSIVVRETHGSCLAIAAFDDVTREAETARFGEQFIGILSHDLRTPISAITMAAGLLVRQGGLAEPQTKNVQRILASADRAARMVSQLLDLTRSRLGGGIQVERRPTNLAQLVRDAAEEVQVSHHERRIVCMTDPSTTCACDPDRMAQVMSNLITNAIQHGTASSPVQVSVKTEGETAIIKVHNEGEAIPADTLPFLFDPFRRGKTEDAGAMGGLGLGLYVASQIVRAHEGTIDVSSTEKAGTTFTVTLPRQRHG